MKPTSAGRTCSRETVRYLRTLSGCALLAMIDRFGKGTGTGLGFVQGFRLRDGAIASTANAVCENIVIVGTNPTDMAVAANHLASLGGGKVVVRGGKVIASVGLPICGLLAEEPMEDVMSKFNRAFEVIAELGCPLKNPFSQLEFCFACGEIGNIKLSEEGLLLDSSAAPQSGRCRSMTNTEERP